MGEMHSGQRDTYSIARATEKVDGMPNMLDVVVHGIAWLIEAILLPQLRPRTRLGCSPIRTEDRHDMADPAMAYSVE